MESDFISPPTPVVFFCLLLMFTCVSYFANQHDRYTHLEPPMLIHSCNQTEQSLVVKYTHTHAVYGSSSQRSDHLFFYLAHSNINLSLFLMIVSRCYFLYTPMLMDVEIARLLCVRFVCASKVIIIELE